MPNTDSHIQIQNNGPLSAKLSFNLNAYIRSFEDYGATSAEHQRIKASLLEELSGITGTLHWSDMLNQCFAPMTNAEETKQIIMQSSASAAMKESFVELIKNLGDEIILRHFSSAYDASQEHKLDLILNVRLENDRVTLVLFDNGPGFSATLLGHLGSEEQMQHYIRETESPKNVTGSGMPELLGGAGRGLKQLIQRILYGTNLEQASRLPDNRVADSSIEFSNNPGACISIMTSSAAQAMPEYIPPVQAHAAAAAAPLPIREPGRGRRSPPSLFIPPTPPLPMRPTPSPEAAAEDSAPSLPKHQG